MTRSTRILLEDILESIGQIEEYVEGISREHFYEDVQRQDAVLRRLGVIGQAVKGLPAEFRDSHPDVPWREIAGARDVVIHEYFRVDLDLTWDMVTQDLPDLKAKLKAILESDS